MHAWVYVCMCMHVCMRACLHVHVCMCTCLCACVLPSSHLQILRGLRLALDTNAGEESSPQTNSGREALRTPHASSPGALTRALLNLLPLVGFPSTQEQDRWDEGTVCHWRRGQQKPNALTPQVVTPVPLVLEGPGGLRGG